MVRINDGGPAFPRPAYYPDDPAERLDPTEDGMSLRDYFAAHALAGYLAAHAAPGTVMPTAAQAAEHAARYADALLRALYPADTGEGR